MIPIKKLKLLIDGFQPISQKIFVRSEFELINKIKDIDNNWIIVVIVPSSDTEEEGYQNIWELEHIIIYIIKKLDYRDQDDTDTINFIEEAQQLIVQFKQYLYNVAMEHDHVSHHLCKQIDFGTLHTDPEYNYYNCDGYSLSFVLKTDCF